MFFQFLKWWSVEKIDISLWVWYKSNANICLNSTVNYSSCLHVFSTVECTYLVGSRTFSVGQLSEKSKWTQRERSVKAAWKLSERLVDTECPQILFWVDAERTQGKRAVLTFASPSVNTNTTTTIRRPDADWTHTNKTRVCFGLRNEPSNSRKQIRVQCVSGLVVVLIVSTEGSAECLCSLALCSFNAVTYIQSEQVRRALCVHWAFTMRSRCVRFDFSESGTTLKAWVYSRTNWTQPKHEFTLYCSFKNELLIP